MNIKIFFEETKLWATMFFKFKFSIVFSLAIFIICIAGTQYFSTIHGFYWNILATLVSYCFLICVTKLLFWRIIRFGLGKDICFGSSPQPLTVVLRITYKPPSFLKKPIEVKIVLGDNLSSDNFLLIPYVEQKIPFLFENTPATEAQRKGFLVNPTAIKIWYKADIGIYNEWVEFPEQIFPPSIMKKSISS